MGKERLTSVLPHDKGKIMSTALTPPASGLPSQSYRSALVSGRKPLRFTFAPDPAARAAIAAELDLLDLPEFSFKGELLPQGRADVLLRADLTALVVQPCSVTLAPVRSKLVDTTEVRFVHDYVEPAADEWEIPADDSVPLPESIDVAAIAIEALTLALPLYPRARGAEFTEAAFAAPGEKPLTSEDLKPFAGLAALADKLKKPDEPKV
jgi:uncharacterized metal-binding protein YceD (DUF177 family)